MFVCTPDDAPTLLFSDSPEMPSTDGVLYADTVPKGRYRLYVYHANGASTERKFPIVVLNQGAATAHVSIVRRGLASPSTQYVAQGQTVLADFFADRAPVDVAVPAGQRVLLDAGLDALHAGQNELVHAIYDVVTDATLKISFVTVAAATDAATATASLSLLARDVDHQRGTFPSADIILYGTSQSSGVQRLRLGANEVDATLDGVDAPTGDAQKLLGNYGVHYHLEIPRSAPTAITARGGAWGGAMRASSSIDKLAVSTTTDAVALGPLTFFDVMTAGGSNLPIDVFFVTP